jgi:hypothetical protein
MKLAAQIVVLILLSAIFSVAQELPVGTMLPVALSAAINADKAKVGERITGTLGQYVIVDSMRLPRGTEVTGRILRVESGSGNTPSQLVLVFDSIRFRGRDIPITTSLRALASMQAVFEAQLPTNTIDDHGSSIRDWNTLQVGGQSVYRGNGTVMEGAEVVGKATIVGEVFGEPKTWPWSACARDRATKTAQSFWVFSTDACGVYGFDGLKLTHAGRFEPVGQIVLESPGKVRVRAGSGLLLMVLSGGQANSEAPSDSRQATLSGSIDSATQR